MWTSKPEEYKVIDNYLMDTVDQALLSDLKGTCGVVNQDFTWYCPHYSVSYKIKKDGIHLNICWGNIHSSPILDLADTAIAKPSGFWEKLTCKLLNAHSPYFRYEHVCVISLIEPDAVETAKELLIKIINESITADHRYRGIRSGCEVPSAYADQGKTLRVGVVLRDA
jgi:hypothetical protein